LYSTRPVEVALSAPGEDKEPTASSARIEVFFERVRGEYLTRSAANPTRMRMNPGRQAAIWVKKDVEDIVFNYMLKHDI